MAHKTASKIFAWILTAVLFSATCIIFTQNASADSFNGTITAGESLYYDIDVDATLFPIVVTISWISPYTDIDLDMYLRNPSGTLVYSATSSSTVQETITNYFPTSTGTYELEVYGADMPSDSVISFTGLCTFHDVSEGSGGDGTSGSNWYWILAIVVAIVAVLIIVLVIYFSQKSKRASQGQMPAYGAQQQYPQQYQYQQQPAQPYPYQPTMTQMPANCPYCGTKLEQGWQACPKCGARIQP